MKIVTRYAPSPTGPQHIGGIRTALYCYLFAKKNQGEFILRVEDTDQRRFVPGAEEFIIEACNWVGITFTQGVHIGGPHAPYRQSERSAIYKKHVDDLIASGHAYLAFDTEAELEAVRKAAEASEAKAFQYNYLTRGSMKNSLTLSAEEVSQRIQNGDHYVVRFRIPENETIVINDIVRGEVVVESNQLDDKVLLKGDGLPTYHLANVVDDHLMEVTHVIRAEEWLPSTPLHVLLYRAFGWQDTMPQFAHLPLMVNPDNSKMSKRNADKFGIPVYPMDWKDEESGETWQGYRELGYLPEALINYIAFLGWNPGDEREFMTLAELADAFSLDRVGKSPMKFDLEKLKHFNQHYLRLKTDAELLPQVKKEVELKGYAMPSDAFLLKLIHLMKERVTFVRDFVALGHFFFEMPAAHDAELVAKKWNSAASQTLKEFLFLMQGISDWNTENLEKTFKDFLESKGVKPGTMMMPFRIMLIGVGYGPSAFEIAALIGKEETLRRAEFSLGKLPG